MEAISNWDVLMIAGGAYMFLVAIPLSINVAHSVFGGHYVSVDGWIGIASFTAVFAATIYFGKVSGLGGWAIIPGMITLWAVMEICRWLELHDAWTEEKPIDTLKVRRLFVGLALGAIGTSILSTFLPLFLAFASLMTAITLGLSAFTVGALGWMKYREDQKRLELHSRKFAEKMLSRQRHR
jgi:hypothetical protein